MAAVAGTAVEQPPTLGDMPTEVLERILTLIDSGRGVARAAAAASLFRTPAERALRERARTRGHAHVLPATLPDGVATWTEELLARERVLELAHAHALVLGRGGEARSARAWAVCADGRAHSCSEDELLALLHAGGAGGDGAPALLAPASSLGGVRVRALAAGHSHTLALSEAGAVYGCGENGCGQLGLGHDGGTERFVPLGGLWARAGGEGGAEGSGALAVGIAVGRTHSLALDTAGRAHSWGGNECGQLGHGDTETRWEPTRIEALDGVRVGGLSAGYAHTLLLSTAGAVYACGDGEHGELGHGRTQQRHRPARIEALAGVRAVHVSAGYEHSLVVDAGGAVHSFGGGGYAKLGHGTEAGELLPRRIDALAGVRAVRCAASEWHSAALDADGGVHAFGDGQGGQLGPQAGALCARGVRVPGPARKPVASCLLTPLYALYATADGCLYARALVIEPSARGQRASSARHKLLRLRAVPPLRTAVV